MYSRGMKRTLLITYEIVFYFKSHYVYTIPFINPKVLQRVENIIISTYIMKLSRKNIKIKIVQGWLATFALDSSSELCGAALSDVIWLYHTRSAHDAGDAAKYSVNWITVTEMWQVPLRLHHRIHWDGSAKNSWKYYYFNVIYCCLMNLSRKKYQNYKLSPGRLATFQPIPLLSYAVPLFLYYLIHWDQSATISLNYNTIILTFLLIMIEFKPKIIEIANCPQGDWPLSHTIPVLSYVAPLYLHYPIHWDQKAKNSWKYYYFDVFYWFWMSLSHRLSKKQIVPRVIRHFPTQFQFRALLPLCPHYSIHWDQSIKNSRQYYYLNVSYRIWMNLRQKVSK